MNNKDIDAQFLCKDCTRYNLCEYYHRRRKDSYICKYFHLSVTPQEPRKGHWTYNRANVRCSCCGKGYKDFYGKANIASYNYCPNCGADMRTSEKNNV